MPTHGVDGGLTVTNRYVGVRDGDPRFTCDGDGPAAVARIMVDWDKVAQAEYEIIGYSVTGTGSGSGGGSAGHIRRWLPENHPRKPWLWATRISECRGESPTGLETVSSRTSIAYRKAIFTVEFNWLPYQVLADSEVASEYERFVELVEDTSAGDYLSPKGMQYKLFWAEGPKAGGHNAIPDNVGRIIPYRLITLRWHRVPLIGLKDDGNVVGKTNSEALGDVGTNPHTYFPAGTLLYNGRRLRTIGSPKEGAFLATVDYQFRYYPYGANKYLFFPDPNTGDTIQWALATTDGVNHTPGSLPDGVATYDETDFLSALFEVN